MPMSSFQLLGGAVLIAGCGAATGDGDPAVSTEATSGQHPGGAAQVEPASAPSVASSASPDSTERAIERWERLAVDLTGTEANCDVAARVVKSFFQDNKALFATVEGSFSNMTSEEAARSAEKYLKRLERPMATLREVTKACVSNERYQEALKAGD